MEVGVQVFREDPVAGENVVATTAHLTMVALGEDKKPVPIGPIVPESDEEKRRSSQITAASRLS